MKRISVFLSKLVLKYKLPLFLAKDIWICKPTGMNQGKGIYLVRDLDEFKVTLQERDEKMQQSRRPPRANMGRIIQRYVDQHQSHRYYILSFIITHYVTTSTTELLYILSLIIVPYETISTTELLCSFFNYHYLTTITT